MAVIFQGVVKIPVCESAPETPFDPMENHWYCGGLFFSSTAVVGQTNKIAFNKLAIYFHGPDDTELPSTNDPLIVALINDGWAVFCAGNFGVKGASLSPWSTGYGSISNPNHYGNMIKMVRWVQSAIQYLYTSAHLFASSASSKLPQCVILAHSTGAAAALAWSGMCDLAGVQDLKTLPLVKGLVGNSATMGYSAANVWNDPMAVIGALSKSYNLVKHPTTMFYNDVDVYAPPGFSKRLALSLPKNSPVTLKSNGALAHDWMKQTTAPWLAELNRIHAIESNLVSISDAIYSDRYYVCNVANPSEPILSYRDTVATYPASLTMLMTALVALEQYNKLTSDKQQTFKVNITSADMVGVTPHNVAPGETLTLNDAFLNMLLTSSNATAMGIARSIGTASGLGYNGIIARMNTMATELGMVATRFNDATGIGLGTQRTTAKDLAYLIRSMHLSSIRTLWRMQKASITVTLPSGATRQMEITHDFDDSLSVTNGVKTGQHTDLHHVAGITLGAGGTENISIFLYAGSIRHRKIDIDAVSRFLMNGGQV